MSRTEARAGKRILALDVGLRRIGLALSDPLAITAQGLDTLERKNIREDLEQLRRIVLQHDVGLIVVGCPLLLSGREGRQAQQVKEFAAKIERACGLPVHFWDERLTTSEATRVLKASGVSVAKRARAIDRLAAVLILQNYLDFRSQAHPWQAES